MSRFSVMPIPSLPISHIVVANPNVPLKGSTISNSIKDDTTTKSKKG